MHGTWKSNDAGILDIIGGMVITTIGVVSPFVIWNIGILATRETRGALFTAITMGAALLSLGLFTIYGGEMAMKRRRLGFAITASLCAAIVILGIPAFIFIILSRKEFARESSQGKGTERTENRQK